MNVTRYWLDANGHPHTEVSEWRLASTDGGAEGAEGELLSVAAPAIITDAYDPGTYVVLVAVAGQAAPNIVSPGYLEQALRPGATVVDYETFQAALDDELAESVNVEQQLVEYLADQVPAEVESMLDKLTTAAGLTEGERSVLASRFS